MKLKLVKMLGRSRPCKKSKIPTCKKCGGNDEHVKIIFAHDRQVKRIGDG
jgi:hypothetical protein